MQVELLEFEIKERIDQKYQRAIATVQIGDKGYYIKGIYQTDINEFQPDILGDPYEIEDYYDKIIELVRDR